ncbi:hypothetical protein DCC39_14480 [Pueribacillus theae]|uniref:Uncharacterized protein n=1 Tax=Pueribacillus theae TaxID=2171751 RepID=A0A2U1JTY7_9BACI|nr:hypothetical protein [Pueribacillus theae]PWA08641.1 hypothetical protein DCC39_14480 [Pueribacillus theae]
MTDKGRFEEIKARRELLYRNGYTLSFPNEDIEYLIEQAERVEEQHKEIELLNNTIEIITRALTKARTRDGERSLEKIRLEKALSFYANKDNYYTDTMDKDNEGETARKALEEINGD